MEFTLLLKKLMTPTDSGFMAVCRSIFMQFHLTPIFPYAMLTEKQLNENRLSKLPVVKYYKRGDNCELDRNYCLDNTDHFDYLVCNPVLD